MTSNEDLGDSTMEILDEGSGEYNESYDDYEYEYDLEDSFNTFDWVITNCLKYLMR